MPRHIDRDNVLGPLGSHPLRQGPPDLMRRARTLRPVHERLVAQRTEGGLHIPHFPLQRQPRQTALLGILPNGQQVQPTPVAVPHIAHSTAPPFGKSLEARVEHSVSHRTATEVGTRVVRPRPKRTHLVPDRLTEQGSELLGPRDGIVTAGNVHPPPAARRQTRRRTQPRHHRTAPQRRTGSDKQRHLGLGQPPKNRATTRRPPPTPSNAR